MLYHVTFDTDHQALGFGETRDQVIAEEIERAHDVQRQGRLMGFWARADLGGAIFVVDAPSHEALMAELRSLPLFGYLRSIHIQPVVVHPQLPEFGVGRRPGEQGARDPLEPN